MFQYNFTGSYCPHLADRKSGLKSDLSKVTCMTQTYKNLNSKLVLSDAKVFYFY